MPPLPEFLLRRLFVKDSLTTETNGFSFQLINSIAPATMLWFSMEVDGKTVLPQNLVLQMGVEEARSGSQISAENPFSLPVAKKITVRVLETDLGSGDLHINIHTREIGSLSFNVKPPQAPSQPRKTAPNQLPSRFQKPIKTDVVIHYDDVIGEIDPNVYGQFIEHLEDCIYGGIWTPDGSALREDTLQWIKDLKSPLIRYPGGNFASGYHWEDGIGPKSTRPLRFDEAWKASESNQVGTDEFMELCQQTGAAPFLVVNCGNGTAEEAARWVAYCNEPASTEQGSRRAENGHPEPYQVKLWGIGNEAWGAWQIGHTDAEHYTRKLRSFAEAMRNVDPTIQLVAVGQAVLSDKPDDAGRLWNETVLSGAGDLIDFLSFHLYQPEREGWQDEYEQNILHHTICAAPLDTERIIVRIKEQIKLLQPERKIGIALDEWNVWLPAPEDAASMHKVAYTLRDSLYTAGMLNVFQRQCDSLKIANLAQLVNVLPLIVTNEKSVYATPLYYPFLLYKEMQNIALQCIVRGKFYDSQALGNITAMQDVPYVDVTATRSADGSKVVLSILNRHPTSRTYVNIDLKEFPKMKLCEGWLLCKDDALAVNSFDNPDNVKSKQIGLPEKRGTRFRLDLPPLSVSILSLRKM
ncbi:MAG: hypothetical protein LLG42_12120 [Chloroflexi bacterium]|nr:hypothetical protein [Chloroflexota bacterium]